jgi:hypothetical protein
MHSGLRIDIDLVIKPFHLGRAIYHCLAALTELRMLDGMARQLFGREDAITVLRDVML